MKVERYYIAKVHWRAILEGWLDHFTVVAPIQEAAGVFLKPVTKSNADDVVYDEIRPVEPLKKYL